MGVADTFYSITTGPVRRRLLLTPVGLALFVILFVLVVAASLWTDQAFDMSWVVTNAGLAAAAGHNWPIFLRFVGGRGLGCFLGILLVIFPWGAPWLLAFLAAGRLLGSSAEWALASVALLPLFAYLLGGSPTAICLGAALLLLTVAKRLEANRRPLPPPGPERRRVLLRRLIWDRDIASHQDWLDRKPAA